jgi:hypothetical protein
MGASKDASISEATYYNWRKKYGGRPSSTMRIFSSAEYCLRVARRMLFTRRSDVELAGLDFYLVSVPSR